MRYTAPKKTRPKFGPAVALVTASLLALPSTHAQEEEKPDGKEAKETLPIRKAAPLFDKRPLRIPRKIGQVEPTAETKKKRPKSIERGTPVAKPTERTPPPPAASGPGFGDLKKSSGKGCVPLKSRDKVQFEFKNADISDVVAAISKHLCKNFIITSKIRSQKFDIISPTPVTVDEAWRAFMSALEANDFTLVQVGRYYKIIQASDGTRAPVPMYEGDEEAKATPNIDRVVTRIWKVKHGGDPAAIVNYLNIFKSSKGQIHPFAATGTIIVTDYGTSIVRLEAVLREIDRPGVLERVHVVDVEFSTASEIADKLNQVFEPSRGGAKGASTPTARVAKAPVAKKDGDAAQLETSGESGPVTVSKIIADDRTNKLIIIASQRALEQIIELKRKLDVPSDEMQGLVHVLRLRHANAEELASTLSSLASGASASKTKRPTTVRGAAAPAAPAGATSATLFSGEVKVTADKPTNSLVITASKSDLNSMKRVIAQLDVPRFQVFVEAVVLEVNIKRDQTLGTSWFGGLPLSIDGQDSPIVFGSNPTQQLSAFQTIAGNPLGLASLLGLSGALRGPTLPGSENFIAGGIPSVGVLLQALKTTNDVNVISTPHLLTMDNEEAEIKVNEKRPFPSGLTLGGLGGLSGLAQQAGANVQGLGSLGGLGLGSVSFNREDVGLTLKIKPQINDQSQVRLELDQELSDVSGIDQVTGQVITANRAAKTVVVVGDQESVVIGGLVRDRESTDESKVPLLGDLPLIGWLFKTQQTITEKVNLLLILTPYIIRGPEDFRRIYDRKMRERKDFVDAFYGETREYRAAIDWEKKLGPIAKFRKAMGEEMNKPENDGPGDGEDLIIKQPVDDVESTDVEIVPLPEGEPSGEASSGEASPEGQVAPPDLPNEPARETPPIVPEGE